MYTTKTHSLRPRDRFGWADLFRSAPKTIEPVPRIGENRNVHDFLRRPAPMPVASTEYCECMSLSPQNDPPASGSIPVGHARTRRWRRFLASLRLIRRRMHQPPALRLPWRILVGTTGTLIVLIGFVFCVTPGPGIASVILGLFILSTEFRWAHRLMRPARVW